MLGTSMLGTSMLGTSMLGTVRQWGIFPFDIPDKLGYRSFEVARF